MSEQRNSVGESSTRTASTNRGGPLAGLRVIELAGLGPAPFAAMLLAELGAEVIRIDRPTTSPAPDGAEKADLLNRSKLSIVLDLKSEQGISTARELVAASDVLLEGFRPGAAEKLGIGPEESLEANPGLVYGRMTGWGQDGPLSASAGHDIGYIALTGALHAIGTAAAPVPPLNLVGDFGGGSLYLVVGVLSALIERQSSGRGQVIDAAIVDGASHLMSVIHALAAGGSWTYERASNMLDGGAPYYDVYATSDGGHMAVGAIEPQFYAQLLELLGSQADPSKQNDRSTWQVTREEFRSLFGSRTRDEWTEVFSGTDACVSPVLATPDAVGHPHISARGTLTEIDGVVQSGPAPRFSRTPQSAPHIAHVPGSDTEHVLRSVLGDARAEELLTARSETR